jgi:hypothetical protein
MSEIISLSVVRREREASQEALWQRFVELQEISKRSGRFEDGIAAAKAYCAFCESFLPRRRG